MKTPYEHTHKIQQVEDHIASNIRTQYSMELDVVDAALDQVLAGLYDFASLKGSPEGGLESARLFLATRSFNSLWNARQVLERGYFQQAMTLIRMTMEDMLVATDITHHPPTLDALLGGKRLCSFASMADRLGPEAREVWNKTYGMLSEYAAHPRTNSLRSLNSIRADGQLHLWPGGSDDKVYTEATLVFLSQRIHQVMATVAQITSPLGSDWVCRAMSEFQAIDALWKELEKKALN